MIFADLLYDFTQVVLVHDTRWADMIRYLVAILSGVVVALLVRLYLTGKTGRMSLLTVYGAVLTYAVVGWAQLIAVSDPANPRNVTALNIGVLLAMVLSLAGTLQSMHVRLFRRD